ncbi:MAG: restriction endonuclease subunit S [Pelobacteraceae bacterium]
MTGWRRARIGDLCEIIKGETGLASSTPGQYPLVATGADRRSCDSWQFDTEAVCIPLVSSTGHGKKTLNYVHYQTGKFAVGTILAAVIPKDPTILTARFLHLYLSHFKDTVLVPLMKGAANVSLSMKEIASVEIPVPPLDEQQSLIDLIFHIEDEHRELLSETNRQGTLLKQLRQAVLQDAVEGKLTTEWRKQHPVVKGDPQYDAVALLAQIKAEKMRLVKAGKIRLEKPLPPIDDNAKTLELPAGWVWCKIDELVRSLKDDIRTGPFGTSLQKQEHKKAGIPVWGIESIDKKGAFTGKNKIFVTVEKAAELKSFAVAAKDIIISRSGTVGELCRLPDDVIFGLISTNLMKISLDRTVVSPDYFCLLFKGTKSIDVQLEVLCFGTTRLFLTQSILTQLLFPLPTLGEQQAIVARVECLMATIDELENQRVETQNFASLLMQAVLREAFSERVER